MIKITSFMKNFLKMTQKKVLIKIFYKIKTILEAAYVKNVKEHIIIHIIENVLIKNVIKNKFIVLLVI